MEPSSSLPANRLILRCTTNTRSRSKAIPVTKLRSVLFVLAAASAATATSQELPDDTSTFSFDTIYSYSVGEGLSNVIYMRIWPKKEISFHRGTPENLVCLHTQYNANDLKSFKVVDRTICFREYDVLDRKVSDARLIWVKSVQSDTPQLMIEFGYNTPEVTRYKVTGKPLDYYIALRERELEIEAKVRKREAEEHDAERDRSVEKARVEANTREREAVVQIASRSMWFVLLVVVLPLSVVAIVQALIRRFLATDVFPEREPDDTRLGQARGPLPIVIAITVLGALYFSVPPWMFYVYLGMSFFTFCQYGIDKRIAIARRGLVSREERRGAPRRVPEESLHASAFFGGWPGALIGQQCFNHKRSKRPFMIRFYVTVATSTFYTAFVAALIQSSDFRGRVSAWIDYAIG